MVTQYTKVFLKNGTSLKTTVTANTSWIVDEIAGKYIPDKSETDLGVIWGDLLGRSELVTFKSGSKITLTDKGGNKSGVSVLHRQCPPAYSWNTTTNEFSKISIMAGDVDGNEYIGVIWKLLNSSVVKWVLFDHKHDFVERFKPVANITETFLNGGYSKSTDPFDLEGGSSTEGGGGGDFDNTSQPVDFPDLPSLSAVDSGFVSVYNPSVEQLQELASFMWSTDFFDNIIKLWADPMEVILNLAMLPVAIPTLGSREIVVGNVSTGVSVSVASSQFMYVDCGSINVNEYWGAYLDYSPYTKISIYLPYVGTHQLNIDDVMSKTVHVKYIVDILSGACVAFVKSGESVLYSYSGNCATNIPVTSANYARSMQAILGAVGGTIGSAISGNGVGVATGIGGMAGAVMSAKPSVERSGNLSGNAGLLGHQYPYLILERPRQCVPEAQNSYSGYPTYMTVSLSSVSGYTVVDSINLKNVNITEVEKTELIDILKKGVYF